MRENSSNRRSSDEKGPEMRGGARRQPARRTFCTLSRLSRAPTKQMGPSHRSREAPGSADLEVLGFRMMEDEGRDGGLRVHHEALGELQADLRRIEQVEEDALVSQLRARGIPEGHAHAAIVPL